MKKLLTIVGLIAMSATSKMQGASSMYADPQINVFHSGQGMSNTWPPGFIWQSQLVVPLIGADTYQRGVGTFAPVSGSEQTISTILPSYVDAWVTNSAFAMITNGMLASGWDTITIQDYNDREDVTAETGIADAGWNITPANKFILIGTIGGTVNNGGLTIHDSAADPGKIFNPGNAQIGTVTYGANPVISINSQASPAYSINYAWRRPFFTRDANNHLTINSTHYTAGMIKKMLDFCHTNPPNRGLKPIRVMSYIAAAKTGIHLYTGDGNPISPLNMIYDDTLQTLKLGFDGLIVDLDANDIDLETVRQGNRLINQAIADFHANDVDGSAPSWPNFMVFRALAPGSTLASPGAVFLPMEAKYELNVIGVPGAYPNYSTFTEPLIEAVRGMSYGSYVGPGHYINIGAWQPQGFTAAQNQYFLSLAAFMCGPPYVCGGIGEEGNTYALATATFQVLTNASWLTVMRDPGVIAGHVAWSNSLNQIWVKPLGSTSSQTNAIMLVNDNGSTQTINLTNFYHLGLGSNMLMEVYDVWNQTYYSNFLDHMQFSIPAHSWGLYTIYPSTFNPSKVQSATLIAWYDFSTVGYNGTNYSSVPDLSGNGNGLVQNTSATPGPYATNNSAIMMGPYGRFVAGLTPALKSINSTAQWFAPGEVWITGTCEAGILFTGDSGNSARWEFGFADATHLYWFSGGGGSLNFAATPGTPAIYRAQANGTSSGVYVNNNSIITLSGSGVANYPLRQICVGSSLIAGAYGTVNVKDVEVYNGLLNNKDANQLLNWKNARSRVYNP